MAKGEWFVSRSGQRFGPVSFEQLKEAAKAGRLEPRTDLIFGGDLSEWTPAGKVDGVFTAKDLENQKDSKKSKKDLNTLADSAKFTKDPAPTNIKMPGVARLGYILGTTLLPAVLFLGFLAATPKMIEFVGPKFAYLPPFLMIVIPLVFYLAITAKRFQNLGMSGWWMLGLFFVPILNLWLGYRLFACPPGYALTKKLDAMGWILALFYWLVNLAYFAWLFVGFGQTVQYLTDPVRIQQVIDELEEQTDSDELDPLIEKLEKFKEDLEAKAKE